MKELFYQLNMGNPADMLISSKDDKMNVFGDNPGRGASISLFHSDFLHILPKQGT